MDQVGLDRQHPPDGLDGRRRLRLPVGAKVQVTDLDPDDAAVKLVSQSASRRNVTVVLDEAALADALARLHDAFFSRDAVAVTSAAGQVRAGA